MENVATTTPTVETPEVPKIDRGLAEEILVENNVSFADIDEVVGHDDLLLVYAKDYGQYLAIINAAEKKGICDSYREIKNIEWKIVLRRR